ncbi:hypothetical protein K438DRAFT_1766827 [Mycena galopus ATCC 62051]|nr:hypothetical protein K438DRAFT_1766827 [Mycena galopus ATCC 62051]
MPSLRALTNAINAPPSPSDGMGGGYAYSVGNVVKFGYSKKPAVRKTQWKAQCRGEQQRWLGFYWEVPYAKKFVRRDCGFGDDCRGTVERLGLELETGILLVYIVTVHRRITIDLPMPCECKRKAIHTGKQC